MANVIKLRRSAVSGNVPTTGQLELGEMAINTADGICYIKRNDGSGDEIVRVGGSSTLQSTRYRYETNTSNNPGSGKIHFDAAFGTDYSGVTNIYFNNTDKAGQDLSNVFDAFLNDTYRIYIQRESDASQAVLFQVTGAVSVGASVTTVPVSFVQDTGVGLTGGKDCAVIFSSDPSASLTLGGLADVSVPAPSDGQVLGWVAANNQWEAINQSGGSGGGGSVTVSATAPSSPSSGDQWYNTDDGRTYIYFTDTGGSSQWADQSPQAPAAQNLGDLGDVDTAGVTDGQVIVYQSGTWQAGDAAASLSDLTDTTITSPAANEILQYNGTSWVNATNSSTSISAYYRMTDYSVPASTSLPSNSNTWITTPRYASQTSGQNDVSCDGSLFTINVAGVYRVIVAGSIEMATTSNNQANGVIMQPFVNNSLQVLYMRFTSKLNNNALVIYDSFCSQAVTTFAQGDTFSTRFARWEGTAGAKTVVSGSNISFEKVD